MKRIAAILVTLAVQPAISSAAEVASAAEAAVGRVYVISGEVTVSRGGKSAVPVKTSEPVVSGTLIRTGENSAALLEFEDEQVVTMQSGTAFEVREYHYDALQIENSKIDCALLEGGVHLITGLIGRNKRLAFSLSTPSATIRGGQAEIVVVKADNGIHSRVLAGEIRVTNSAGTASFKAGQTAVVLSSLRLASAFYPTASRDLFSEVLSISVTPPVIVEPEPVPAAALAAAPEAAPTPVPEPAPAPEPAAPVAAVPVPVPVPAPLASVTLGGPAQDAVPEPVPAPSSELAPEDIPESVTADLPEAVPASPQPLAALEPETAPVAESVPLPVQGTPACTCSCTVACK